MKKIHKNNFKFLMLFVAFCLSIYAFYFNVFSLKQIDYSLDGNMDYKMSHVYVNVETKVYGDSHTEISSDDELNKYAEKFMYSTPQAVYGPIDDISDIDKSLSICASKDDMEYYANIQGQYVYSFKTYKIYVMVIKITNLAENILIIKNVKLAYSTKYVTNIIESKSILPNQTDTIVVCFSNELDGNDYELKTGVTITTRSE